MLRATTISASAHTCQCSCLHGITVYTMNTLPCTKHSFNKFGCKVYTEINPAPSVSATDLKHGRAHNVGITIFTV